MTLLERVTGLQELAERLQNEIFEFEMELLRIEAKKNAEAFLKERSEVTKADFAKRERTSKGAIVTAINQLQNGYKPHLEFDE